MQTYHGKFRGLVMDNADPETRGRLSVTVPSVLGDLEVWAMPCVPFAGPNQGLFAMPPVGANVWVEFEAGNTSYPIWVGCFWKEDDLDPNEARPNVKMFRTEKFSLTVDDENGDITIENEGGTRLLLTAIDGTLESGTVYVKGASGRKIALTASGVSVNDGALEVT